MPKKKEKKKKRMVNITINIPDIYDANIQKLIKMKITPSRSECIRTALREFFRSEYEIMQLLGFFDGIESEKKRPGRKLGGTNFKTKIESLETENKRKNHLINYLKSELDKHEKGVKNGNTE